MNKNVVVVVRFHQINSLMSTYESRPVDLGQDVYAHIIN